MSKETCEKPTQVGGPTNEEKARNIMCRTGQPGNRVAGFSAAEVSELAGVYDACAKEDERLAQLVAEFWERRQAGIDMRTTQPGARRER